jgi:hypothetical protein
MPISLIANSGIQFIRSNFSIDTSNQVIKSMGFCEIEDYDPMSSSKTISLELAYYLSTFDFWVLKKDLKKEDKIDSNNKISSDLNEQVFNFYKIDDDEEFKKRYSISDISQCLDLYSSTGDDSFWIPIPYFKSNYNSKNEFGPTAWARMVIYKAAEKNTYEFVIAFDTKLEDEAVESYLLPNSNDTIEGENYFSFVDDEDFLLKFLDKANNNDWVLNGLRNGLVNRGRIRQESESLKYAASYIFLVRYLKNLKSKDKNTQANQTPIFENVFLFSDKSAAIDVDLVLDIGNSNTCGVLFENEKGNFEFNKVKKLHIQDLSDFRKKYDDSFAMQLAFAKPSFGEITIPGYKVFSWPSIVRVGEEAANHINSQKFDVVGNFDSSNYHSSPKRYLWDSKKSEIPWEYIKRDNSLGKEYVYYEGLSEQFLENGDVDLNGNSDCNKYYSRKSLMTLVFIEIYLHAISQINSPEFRNFHGNPQTPRKLRRITITCPTSIIKDEQVALRKCALDAYRVVKRFYDNSYSKKYDIKLDDIKIIPDPKDLSIKNTEIDIKQHWIYDEATCCQLVFLYAELSKRYLNNAETFFELYGKKRLNNKNKLQNSLTIASLDIGGGTSDLMICNYEYEKGQGMSVITPNPLFWDSYNLAGDDLLKEIVQQIIIEGVSTSNNNLNLGIKNACIKSNVINYAEKLNNFFGVETNRQSFQHCLMKKNFVTQIAIPIALKYLEHSIDNKEDQEVDINYFFPNNAYNPQLIEYFNNHFSPLKFQDIKWTLSKTVVNSIIEIVFEPLFKQLAALMSVYNCDFVLLAGRPTTIPHLRNLFIKYYPTSPDRIITLKNYRVGSWYPFATDSGYFAEPKTIVSVGAIIALMGGFLDKLDGFRLNTKYLKDKLLGTSEYIGVMNKELQKLVNISISPEANNSKLEVHSLPLLIGYKQLNNNAYRARPLYKLDFNKNYFVQRVKSSNQTIQNENEVLDAANKLIVIYKQKMPLTIYLSREVNESKEALLIENILDNEGSDVSKQSVSLEYMTLPDEKGYWLDTGEFILNIK